MSPFPYYFGMSDAAICGSETAAFEHEHAHEPTPAICADCALPAAMAFTEDGVVPVDGRFDADEVVHRACYDARCTSCGAAHGSLCEHRADRAAA